MSWDANLLCARCKHRADYHGIDTGCMVRNPSDCDCPATEERIWERAFSRLNAGMAFNTEDDPDAEQRERSAAQAETTRDSRPTDA